MKKMLHAPIVEQAEMNQVYSSDMVIDADDEPLTVDSNKNKKQPASTPDTIDPYINIKIVLPRWGIYTSKWSEECVICIKWHCYKEIKRY
jgi:hypothetical protein